MHRKPETEMMPAASWHFIFFLMAVSHAYRHFIYQVLQVRDERMRAGFNVQFAVKVGCDGKDGGNNKAGRKVEDSVK